MRLNLLPVQCGVSRCPRKALVGGRCREHSRGRGGWVGAGKSYGGAWARLVARRLAEEPTCRRCGSRERLEVDHIVSRGMGGPDTFENTQTLCHRCHLQKTAQESHAGRKRKRAMR